jgi:hypothetical protein
MRSHLKLIRDLQALGKTLLPRALDLEFQALMKRLHPAIFRSKKWQS